MNQVNEMVAEREGKVDDLISRMSIITRTEQRLNDINVMAEELNAKITALKDEEKTMEKAGEQVVELKFLLGEIEKKLSDYFNLKGGE